MRCAAALPPALPRTGMTASAPSRRWRGMILPPVLHAEAIASAAELDARSDYFLDKPCSAAALGSLGRIARMENTNATIRTVSKPSSIIAF